MMQGLKSRERKWFHHVAHAVSSDSVAPLVKAAQLQLFLHYQSLAREKRPLPSIFDTGYRVYSQFEEDGMLVFLFAVLGGRSKTFVDIGSADGVSSNCANLAIHFGWHG